MYSRRSTITEHWNQKPLFRAVGNAVPKQRQHILSI
jgi:hypothetical protein